MARSFPLLVALVLVVGGCASAQSSTSLTELTQTSPPAPTVMPSSSTPAPTVMPSSTPTALTVAEAANAYAALFKTYSAAYNTAYNKYGKTVTLTSQKKYWAAVAANQGTFIAGLKKIAFPPEVAADATAFVKALVVAQRYAITASKSTSKWIGVDGDAAYLKAVAAADKNAILRDDLGLPPSG